MLLLLTRLPVACDGGKLVCPTHRGFGRFQEDGNSWFLTAHPRFLLLLLPFLLLLLLLFIFCQDVLPNRTFRVNAKPVGGYPGVCVVVLGSSKTTPPAYRRIVSRLSSVPHEAAWTRPVVLARASRLVEGMSLLNFSYLEQGQVSHQHPRLPPQQVLVLLHRSLRVQALSPCSRRSSRHLVNLQLGSSESPLPVGDGCVDEGANCSCDPPACLARSDADVVREIKVAELDKRSAIHLHPVQSSNEVGMGCESSEEGDDVCYGPGKNVFTTPFLP
mmetsp:Transcript_11605/g.26588  ORF Transcript_11605/g.26588 Transcript_11605/m.26588 type:complete len:274 (+) Transcript_11605:1375-2196(+)